MNESNIGRNIKTVRKSRGFTQEKLSNKLGVSIMTIRRWESGSRIPKFNTVEKIADALGITTDQLINPSYEFKAPPTGQSNNKEVMKQWIEKKEREKLLKNFGSVSLSGKQKIVEYSELIASHPDYKK